VDIYHGVWWFHLYLVHRLDVESFAGSARQTVADLAIFGGDIDNRVHLGKTLT
jgi:hypothetical protein